MGGCRFDVLQVTSFRAFLAFIDATISNVAFPNKPRRGPVGSGSAGCALVERTGGEFTN